MTYHLKSVWMVCILSLPFLGCAGQSNHTLRGEIANDVSKSLREPNEDFTYRGKAIHPALVRRFHGWSSDGGPIVKTVDVAAAEGTDEYSAPFTRNGERIIMQANNTSRSEWFAYRRLGTLRDGTHVLETSFSGGGSGVFQELVFVHFTSKTATTVEGRRREELLMTVVDTFPLGDRDDGAIKLHDDRVIVGPSRHRDKEVVLTIPEASR